MDLGLETENSNKQQSCVHRLEHSCPQLLLSVIQFPPKITGPSAGKYPTWPKIWVKPLSRLRLILLTDVRTYIGAHVFVYEVVSKHYLSRPSSDAEQVSILLKAQRKLSWMCCRRWLEFALDVVVWCSQTACVVVVVIVFVNQKFTVRRRSLRLL